MQTQNKDLLSLSLSLSSSFPTILSFFPISKQLSKFVLGEHVPTASSSIERSLNSKARDRLQSPWYLRIPLVLSGGNRGVARAQCQPQIWLLFPPW